VVSNGKEGGNGFRLPSTSIPRGERLENSSRGYRRRDPEKKREEGLLQARIFKAAWGVLRRTSQKGGKPAKSASSVGQGWL